MQQQCQKVAGERAVSSTNGVGTTGCPYAKERSWSPTSHYAQKLNQNGSMTKYKKKNCKTLRKKYRSESS